MLLFGLENTFQTFIIITVVVKCVYLQYIFPLNVQSSCGLWGLQTPERCFLWLDAVKKFNLGINFHLLNVGSYVTVQTH